MKDKRLIEVAFPLVQPSSDIEDVRARNIEVERTAMSVVIAHESAQGSHVPEVSTPDKARVARLINSGNGTGYMSRLSAGVHRRTLFACAILSEAFSLEPRLP